MSWKTKSEKSKNWIRLALMMLVILILWGGSWFFIDHYYPVGVDEVGDSRGTFGDKFGFINSLFSGLALGGIIYSIILQQKELKLQRDELKETREEFKDQNFQTTFFNLLRTQRDIVDTIELNTFYINSHGRTKRDIHKGRKAFHNSKAELSKIFKAIENGVYLTFDLDQISDVIQTIEEKEDQYSHAGALKKFLKQVTSAKTLIIYNISREDFNSFKELKIENDRLSYVYKVFFKRHSFSLGHYFRHLYHILLFLDNSKNEKILSLKNLETKKLIKNKKEIEKEYQSYANFVKSQMDAPEQFLLFYNSFCYPKSKSLLIKYGMLDTLQVEHLISPDHNIITEFKLLE